MEEIILAIHRKRTDIIVNNCLKTPGQRLWKKRVIAFIRRGQRTKLKVHCTPSNFVEGTADQRPGVAFMCQVTAWVLAACKELMVGCVPTCSDTRNWLLHLWVGFPLTLAQVPCKKHNYAQFIPRFSQVPPITCAEDRTISSLTPLKYFILHGQISNVTRSTRNPQFQPAEGEWEKRRKQERDLWLTSAQVW